MHLQIEDQERKLSVVGGLSTMLRALTVTLLLLKADVVRAACRCYDCCDSCFNTDNTCMKDCAVCTSSHCNDNGIRRYANQGICFGPANGCSDSNSANQGCYGKDSSGKGGTCDCSTGAFSNPESYEIGGVVKNLAPAQTLTLKMVFAGAEGGKLNKEMLADLYDTGRFTFPMKLAQGNVFKVDIAKQPQAQTCLLHQNTERVGTSNVQDLRVTCFMRAGMKAEEQKLAVRQQKAEISDKKSILALSDDVTACDDSKMLLAMQAGMLPRRSQIRRDSSTVPCKREYTLDRIERNAIKYQEYLTEVRGQSCVEWQMESDQYMSACFLPATQWFNQGTKRVLANLTLCPCSGKIFCHQKQTTLPNVTYMLLATSFGDDFKVGHGTKPLHLRIFIGRCGLTLQQDLMIGGVAAVLGLLLVLLKSVLKKGGKQGYEEIPKAKGGARYIPHQNL